jgi:uncharacterized protein (DUF342 family)
MDMERNEFGGAVSTGGDIERVSGPVDTSLVKSEELTIEGAKERRAALVERLRLYKEEFQKMRFDLSELTNDIRNLEEQNLKGGHELTRLVAMRAVQKKLKEEVDLGADWLGDQIRTEIQNLNSDIGRMESEAKSGKLN